MAVGATVRIADADAGLTAAVLRSSRALPAARNNAAPRAADAVGSVAGAVRASPPIDASASPPTGRYDGPGPAGEDSACVAAGLVAVVVAGPVAVVAAAGVAAAVDMGRAVDGDDMGVGDCAAGRDDAAGRGSDESVAIEGLSAAAAAAGRLAAAGATAGDRRTTADSAAPAARAAAIDGAAGSDRRAVAAATVNAGPVARRSAPVAPVRMLELTAPGEPVSIGPEPMRPASRAEISGSTAPMPRAAVSPGAECAARAPGADAASAASLGNGGEDDAAGAGDGDSGDCVDGDRDVCADGAGTGAGADDDAAIDRRTTGPGVAALDVPVAAVVRGAGGVECAAAAAAARERGVAAWRNAPQRPTGGLGAAAATACPKAAGLAADRPVETAAAGGAPAR